MPKATRVVLLLLLFAACKSEPVRTIDCPYYWTAVKDGKTLHLLGTIHGGIEATQLPKHVWDDLKAAPALALEADIDDPSLMEKIKRPGPTLRDELGPEDWSKLEKAIGPATANAIVGMKPFMAAAMISLQQMPKQVKTPMDAAVLNAAKKQHKRVVFLESIDRQLEVMDKHMTVREVRLMLKDPSGGRAEMAKLLAAYEAGDEAALSAVVAAARAEGLKQGYTEAELDVQHADLITGRNQSWIEPLEQLHAAGGGFVAVGAGHLVGKGSVNELLAAKGYTVQRAACPAKK